MASHDATAIIVSEDPNLAGALAAALAGGFDVTVLDVTGQERIDAIDQHEPSIIIYDLGDPASEGMPGFAATVATLILGPADPAAMIEAVEAGALGYLDRESPFKTLEEGVRSVSQGTAIIPPLMLGSLLHHVVERRRVEAKAVQQLEVLTPRETEVFQMTALGLGHEEVAERLFISPATARTHLQRIFKKLDIHSRAELVALAATCGLPTSEET